MAGTNQTPPFFAASISAHASPAPVDNPGGCGVPSERGTCRLANPGFHPGLVYGAPLGHSPPTPSTPGRPTPLHVHAPRGRSTASLIEKAPKPVPGRSRQAIGSGTSTPTATAITVTTVDMVCIISDSIFMAIASTTLQVRLPVKLRDEASVTLEEMGLDLPTAIRLYLTKVVKTRRIPFELEADPVVEAVEAIEVDEALQGRMDRIGTAWKKAAKKR